MRFLATCAALIIASAHPAWGQCGPLPTFGLNPPATTAGAGPFDLIVTRSATAGGEGFTSDELDGFTWTGPSNPNSSPTLAAELIGSFQVKLKITAELVRVAGNATIQYVVHPNGTSDPTTCTRTLPTFTINPAPKITTSSLPPGKVGDYYDERLTATGGTGALTWRIVSGSLPGAVTLRADNGLLSSLAAASGQFSLPGSSTFTVEVKDSIGVTDQKVFTIVVTANTGPPRPLNRHYTLVRGQTLSLPEGTLREGAGGDTTPSVVSGPNQGSISLGGFAGEFSYTPRPDFVGEDSFVYRLTSRTDTQSGTGTVSITVVGGGAGVCSISPSSQITSISEGGEVTFAINYAVTVTYNGQPLARAPVAGSFVNGRYLSSGRTDPAGLITFRSPSGVLIKTAGAYGNNGSASYGPGEAGPDFSCNGLISVQDTLALEVLHLCFCLFDTALGKPCEVPKGSVLPSAPNPGGLDQFRAFRDKVLTPNVRGSNYADLYYRFRPELLRIMLSNPSLLWRARAALEQNDSLVRALLRGEKVKVSPAEAKQVDGLFQSIEESAGPELRKALGGIRRDMADQKLMASFGLKMEEAPGGRTQTELRQAFGKLPLHFEAAQDRTDPSLRFVARGPGYDIRLRSNEAVLTIGRSSSRNRGVGMKLVGGSRQARIEAESALPGATHYLLGRDSKDWHTGVRRYARVRYRQVYSGIDLVYYGNQQQLEYDLIVAAGAAPQQIRFAFSGVDQLETNSDGDLKLHQSGGELLLRRPVAYQEIAGARRTVEAEYVVMARNQIGFRVGAYDKTQPLVIDPVLSYASMLGGSGLDFGMGIAVDAAGNAYVTGATTSANLSTLNPFQQKYRDGSRFHADGFVTKFDPTGSKILYSTYFGGSDDDTGVGITVDALGNAYVTGATRSVDFPTVQPIQPLFGGAGEIFKTDAFALKLDATGSKLLYSTYLGGSGDDGARSIAIDAAGNAYVAGITSSPNFPIRSGLQSVNRGGQRFRSDGFVAKINAAGNALVYSTYLGGSGDDSVIGLAVDAAGNAYLSGFTYSSDFPLANPVQRTAGGAADAFVAKLNATGSALVYATYLGGSSDDFGSAVAVDADGNAYVTGYTGSAADFPLVNAAQPKFGSADGLGFDSFVTKVNPAGSALVYSTFLGGGGRDYAYAVVVDAQGNAYVAGETDSTDFASPGALQATPGGRLDGFVAKLNANGSTFDYRTYLGGAEDDGATSLALDRSGNLYLTGVSISGDGPATFGAFQTNRQGLMDAVVVKIGSGAAPPGFASVSAASFTSSPGLATQSIASGFGVGLSTTVNTPPGAVLPTVLDGASVTVKDSAGTERLAPLFVVAPTQINYQVPDGTQNGLAAITVKRGGVSIASGVARILPVAPSLFTANADGRGVAAGLVLRVAANGSRSTQPLYQCGNAAGSCTPSPIDLGPSGEQVFLLLFGTGIRNLSTAAVATVGGVTVPVLAAVPQGQFQGLDQVNLGPLPRTLAGKGVVDIAITVDGFPANLVTMNVR